MKLGSINVFLLFLSFKTSTIQTGEGKIIHIKLPRLKGLTYLYLSINMLQKSSLGPNLYMLLYVIVYAGVSNIIECILVSLVNIE